MIRPDERLTAQVAETLDQALDEALSWLDAGESGADQAASAARWQRSPWTVFGWSSASGGSGFDVPGSAGHRSHGGVQVYGEGGAVPPR